MSTAENLVCYFKMNSSIDPLFVEMLYIPSTTEHEAGPPSPETQQRSSSVSSNLLKDSRACLQLVQGDLDTHRSSLFSPLSRLDFLISVVPETALFTVASLTDHRTWTNIVITRWSGY